MTIDVYTSTGKKSGTATLPASLFEASINEGLMHRAVVRQQSNARQASSTHVQTRADVKGSRKKLYRQKGTGNARRGTAQSPMLRGGGKAFGPRNNRNFVKNMPRKQRRAALCSCLSLQAKEQNIIGLKEYGEDHKTKTFLSLLDNLPVDIGRKILFVLPASMPALELGARNVPGVRMIQAPYLNPVDVLTARTIVFHVDALPLAEQMFARPDTSSTDSEQATEVTEVEEEAVSTPQA